VSIYPEVAFALDSPRRKPAAAASASSAPISESVDAGAPRIARLLALAIRLDGLFRAGAIRDYAEVARRGRVTRARLTQIMKLLDLAPDIQETILFLPLGSRLKERNLRRVTATICWDEQRRLFQELALAEKRKSLCADSSYES
jgi:hypothetical protein